MPQTSRDERVEVNNKTCKKRAASSKKTACARHSLTSSVGGKSTGSTRDTIPRQKDKRKQQRLGERDKENYQSILGKKPQKKRKVDVARRSPSCKNLRNEKPSHSTKHVTDSLLQDELFSQIEVISHQLL